MFQVTWTNEIAKSADVPFQDTIPARLLVIELCRSDMMTGNPRASDHAMVQRATPPSQETRTEPMKEDRQEGRKIPTGGAGLEHHGRTAGLFRRHAPQAALARGGEGLQPAGQALGADDGVHLPRAVRGDPAAGHRAALYRALIDRPRGACK